MSELPSLPKGWVWATLGDFIESIEAGKSFKCEERPPQDDEVGVVKVSAVTWGEYDESESKTCLEATRIDPRLFVEPGDFLFSRANTIALVGAAVIARRVTAQIMLSDKILRFKFSGVLPEWVLHMLRTPHGRAEIERLATGNQESMRNIGQDRIRQIRLPLPPLVEQRRIVAAIEKQLTRLDAGVAALRGVQARLKRYRAAVLKAAVEGQLTAEWRLTHPDVEPASVLLARILAERRTCWEAEQRAKGKDPAKVQYQDPQGTETVGLPELPEGWCWAIVEQLISSLRNGLPQKPSEMPPGYPILRINAVRPMVVHLREARYLQLTSPWSGGHHRAMKMRAGAATLSAGRAARQEAGLSLVPRARR